MLKIIGKIWDKMSSPARGTWIEIFAGGVQSAGDFVVPRKGDVDRNGNCRNWCGVLGVVPRKGDVDRNTRVTTLFLLTVPSSPARGTWIEMPDFSHRCG